MSDSFSISFIQKWAAYRGLLTSAFGLHGSQRPLLEQSEIKMNVIASLAALNNPKA